MIKKVNEIKGYEKASDNYFVNDLGEILSKRMGMKPIKLSRCKPTKKSRNNYLQFCLASNVNRDVKLYGKVHILVAKAFIPNPEKKPQVNHIDKNGCNNNVDNLEWMTAKENSRYSNAKKVYCYDLSGLVKVYDSAADVVEDGFNSGHVCSICRGYVPKNRKNPVVRHKGHTFSYHELSESEVVQRLSKAPRR